MLASVLFSGVNSSRLVAFKDYNAKWILGHKGEHLKTKSGGLYKQIIGHLPVRPIETTSSRMTTLQWSGQSSPEYTFLCRDIKFFFKLFCLLLHKSTSIFKKAGLRFCLIILRITCLMTVVFTACLAVRQIWLVFMLFFCLSKIDSSLLNLSFCFIKDKICYLLTGTYPFF